MVQDLFTKYISLYPLKKITTRATLNRLMKNHFVDHGKPSRILSDHGTQFTSSAWKDTLEGEGIAVLFSSIRHPQSNPVERVMRELGRLFRTFCSERHQKWAKCVPEIEKLLNIVTHTSTGFTPYELQYGRSPQDIVAELVDFPGVTELGIELRYQLADQAMQKAFEQRARGQKNVTKIVLEAGDLVLLRVPHLSNAVQQKTHKFFHLYQGPYVIGKSIGKNAFELRNRESNTVLGVYNRSNLRKYYSS